MNKNLYRIVFNQARGLLMAVAECVASTSKGAWTGACSEGGGSQHRWVTLRPLLFALWSVLGMVSWPGIVTAQIVADTGAPKNQQPNIGTTANGVPLVNIQTPSAAGVSRNTYTQFDVNSQGAILNNARTNTKTEMGGWVQGNAWLAGGAARVILNEVNSLNPSQLRGYVEVAGERAQVVIANPAGVTCDGCGFINANRATLTTGTPIMNGGSLEGYRVQGGSITIQGSGLDGRNADYTDLIARSIQVNAGVWAQNLKAVAGANQVSADLSQATPISGQGAVPAFAIDVAQLGGMYAGKIVLVGTEAGVGVRNAGHLGASVGEVAISVDGRLENSGRLVGATDIRIDSTGSIGNSGTIFSQGSVVLDSQDALENRGTIAATNDLLLTAKSIDNESSTLGSIQGDVKITSTAGMLNNNAGRIEAGRHIQIASLGLVNIGGTLTGQDVSINSNGKPLDNTRGSLAARGTLDILSAALNNDTGLIQAAGALTIDTQGEKLTNTNAGTAGGILGQSEVTLKTGNLDNTSGFIGAQGDLSITGQAISNTGTIASESDMLLHGSKLDNRGGKMRAQGDLTIDTGNGEIDNTSGTDTSLMRSGQTLTLKAKRIINIDTLDAQKTDQGIEGKTVAITTERLDNAQGAIRANDLLALTSSGVIDNTKGLFSSGKRVVIADGAAKAESNVAGKTLVIANAEGTMIAGEALAIDSATLTGNGKVLSLGDLHANFSGDYTNTGDVEANGSLLVETLGKLTNKAKLQGGTAVDIHGAEIENTAQGEIDAASTTVKADGLLTNRGVIDGSNTWIKAAAIDNIGSGQFYGDRLAIEASTLNNLAEGGKAAYIGARERLDIGVQNLSNQEGASITSEGHLAIGGSLDADRKATGKAVSVDNASATIQAQGDVSITAETVSNRNLHFVTKEEVISSEFIQEYQGYGSMNRYLPYQISLPTVRDSFYRLSAPDGQFDKFYRYDYTRTIKETRVQSSAPGQILATRNLRIDADSVLNDLSRIVAGGALQVTTPNLVNTEFTGQRVVTDVGTMIFHLDHQPKGKDNDWTERFYYGYSPAATITGIRLTPTQFDANTPPGANGTQIAALSINRVSQGASGSGNSVVSLDNPASLAGSLNSSSLFSANPKSDNTYIIESNSRFTNYRTWLSSDYMLQQLAVDPTTIQKRLGDGYYEQQLIREQVTQLTGRRFLDSYASDEAQYRGLIDQGVTFAKTHQLVPGVALTPAQMAQLTSDIVWLVEKDVTLPDGTQTRALVPQVYARLQPGGLDGNGALLAGSNVDLNIGSRLTNSGTIGGRNVVSLTADTIDNLGGRIAGNNVALTARTDLNNLGGLLQGGDSLMLSAGRDINVASTTRTSQTGSGERTNVDRVAGLYVSNPNAVLLASAGRDVNLMAAQVVNEGTGGTTAIAAGNNLNLGTVTESARYDALFNSGNTRRESQRQDVGTVIQTSGDIQLLAGQDINARAAQVTSDKGAVLANAGRDIAITAGDAGYSLDSTSYSKSTGSWGSKKTVTTRDSVRDTSSIASTFSGDTIQLQSGRDLTVSGSNVVSTKGTVLQAGNNLTIEAARETHQESHFREEKKSGFLTGGGSITIGTQQKSSDGNSRENTSAASTIGSTDGNVILRAGSAYSQVGSHVLAPQGDIAISAQKVDILAAENTLSARQEDKVKQSGVTLGVSSPILAALETAQQMKKAGSQTSDDRMKALAGASTALAGKNAVDAVAKDPSAGGGVGISIMLGSSRNETVTTREVSTAESSTVVAGGDIRIEAKGGGKQSDVTIGGSQVKAGGDLSVAADNDINLLAAQNTDEMHRKSSGQSGGVGVSITYGSNGFAFGVTVSASGSRGKGEGTDVAWTETQLQAGQKLALNSGADTNLKGATAEGKQVSAQVGGDLNIESLQDSSSFHSKDQSIGGSVTIGYGFSASLNASQQKIDGDFRSVQEQSGLKAGDDGFQVTVKGNTDLKGAVISSTDKAVEDGKNSLSTGTLTTSELENKAEYKASSVSLGGGYTSSDYSMAKGDGSRATPAPSSGVGTDAKGEAQTGSAQTPGSALPSTGGASATTPIALSAKGSDSSTTSSGISGGTITITDDAGQQAKTGKSGEETIASLNRDVATGQDSANALKPILNEQEIQAGFQITQAFAQQVGTFLTNRAKDADEKIAQAKEADRLAADPTSNLTDEQRQWLRDQAGNLRSEANAINENWGAGGSYRQIATALVAAASGNVTGSNAQFAQNMLVNYVQQQGATYIGKLVADGTLTEGSPLHAAMHAIVACAGAAASSQACSSGALGGATSSLLTGLFSETSPDETATQREAKRNLITSLVTGIATVAGNDATAAGNASIAAVDNNWLATQQKVQMNKELAKADSLLEKVKVLGKWAYVSGKQDVLTTAGIGKGLAESGWSDIQGLKEFLQDPIAGLNGLKELVNSQAARSALGDSISRELDNKITRMEHALEQGGDANAEQLGRDLGALIWQVGSVATGVGAAAKGGAALAKIGVNVSKNVLEGMAVSKAYKLADAEAIASAKQYSNFYRDGAPTNFPIELKTSSGIVIKSNPDKVTTILGTYSSDTGRIINSELGIPKSMAIDGAQSTGFNLLNTPDGLYATLGPEKFWTQVNKPWLDSAIARGDDIVLATKPELSTLKSANSYDGLSGFGREFEYLRKNGFVYEEKTGKMCLGGCK